MLSMGVSQNFLVLPRKQKKKKSVKASKCDKFACLQNGQNWPID